MSEQRPVPLREPGKVNLKNFGHGAPEGLEKEAAVAMTSALGQEMEKLFDLLNAAGSHSLLIVLQGMDTSGKDGAIRHLLQYCHAQNCHVTSFKVPTAAELAHDFLWRVHPHAPAGGGIAVFNRSHYEDVVVVRVHKLIDKAELHARYQDIRQFEELLARSGTIILKFFLHISKDEQERRLLDREEDVAKAWKLSVGDWRERELWQGYQEAYEDAIGATAAGHAPWFTIPAIHKWYRDLAITQAVVEALKPHKDTWLAHLEQVGETEKTALAEFRRGVNK